MKMKHFKNFWDVLTLGVGVQKWPKNLRQKRNDTPCAKQKFFLPLKSSQTIHIKSKITFFI